MNRRTVLKGGLVLAVTSHTAIADSAIAEPSPMSVDDFLANATPAERAQYHANALAGAMNEIHPGTYEVKVDHDFRLAIVWDLGGKAVKS
ncbi:hypothetical protein [Ferirhizobium litorale]|uniref:PepSY domain-containing protein n=1 Tax=Ferirhizobium litorale TaxID=2927786 RepID=A0AAE3QBD9_9HYPH|nr:hypothetical protein [Fererhizobium litorale]MDI7921751.1 hypothetical protein [Fererhizobium litorale]